LRSLLALGVLGLLATLLATGSQGAAAAPTSLQAQIDRAQPGATIVIEGGTYEAITIDKPATEGLDCR
jgi:nitrous oxidase accessory protein NosD